MSISFGPTHWQAAGLSIQAYAPHVLGGGWLEGLTGKYTSYNHEVLAVGGAWTAALGLTLPLLEAEDWYENGLGRQIKVFNPAGEVVWAGFVNQITLNAGALSEVRGPLMDLANRVSATYAPLDASVYPPVVGQTTTTLIAEDTESQAQYGILEKVVNAGTATEVYADKVRDVYLDESSQPGSTGELSLAPGSAQIAKLTLDCLGHVHWLMVYIYNNTDTGLGFLSDKILDILAADPNGVLSTDYSALAENLFLTPLVENENRFAWDILQGLLALGNDTDDARRLFGVYDKKARYTTVAETVAYHHRLADPAQRVTTPEGALVYPWDVQPGQWLFVPDFLVGRPSRGTELRKDPRYKFLEAVRYTAPWGLDLSGGKTDRLSQLLAKLTFTGGLL